MVPWKNNSILPLVKAIWGLIGTESLIFAQSSNWMVLISSISMLPQELGNTSPSTRKLLFYFIMSQKLGNTSPSTRKLLFYFIMSQNKAQLKIFRAWSGPKSLTFGRSSNWLVLIASISMIP